MNIEKKFRFFSLQKYFEIQKLTLNICIFPTNYLVLVKKQKLTKNIYVNSLRSPFQLERLYIYTNMPR